MMGILKERRYRKSKKEKHKRKDLRERKWSREDGVDDGRRIRFRLRRCSEESIFLEQYKLEEETPLWIPSKNKGF